VDIETCVLPGEDLVHKGKANEFFPKKQREDFMSEELSNKVIMEAGDMVEGAIWGCAPLGHQDMDVRMKVDAISEGLDDRNDSWHQLMACDGTEIFR
jgi:hypothetical protein